MNLDFTYKNPTTIYFGKKALDNLKHELAKYGDTILLAYGKGSIKKMGLYDQVIAILQESGKTGEGEQRRFDSGCWWWIGNRLCQGHLGSSLLPRRCLDQILAAV
jgi:hypothetical protein